jgi:hypothetical protein
VKNSYEGNISASNLSNVIGVSQGNLSTAEGTRTKAPYVLNINEEEFMENLILGKIGVEKSNISLPLIFENHKRGMDDKSHPKRKEGFLWEYILIIDSSP